MSIIIDNISKTFGETTALDHVSFKVLPGKITVLFGPSGSGKTTLLRIIAGLESPDTGTVKYTGTISLVGQNAPFLRHKSARENILYGLDVRRYPKPERERRFKIISDFAGCETFLSQKADTLSGGQRQRMILARALISDPDIVLVDETFSNLDEAAADELMEKIKATKKTVLLVTHKRELTDKWADVVIEIESGKIKAED